MSNYIFNPRSANNCVLSIFWPNCKLGSRKCHLSLVSRRQSTTISMKMQDIFNFFYIFSHNTVGTYIIQITHIYGIFWKRISLFIYYFYDRELKKYDAYFKIELHSRKEIQSSHNIIITLKHPHPHWASLTCSGSAAVWFNKGCARRFHVHVIMHEKDL